MVISYTYSVVISSFGIVLFFQFAASSESEDDGMGMNGHAASHNANGIGKYK